MLHNGRAVCPVCANLVSEDAQYSKEKVLKWPRKILKNYEEITNIEKLKVKSPEVFSGLMDSKSFYREEVIVLGRGLVAVGGNIAEVNFLGTVLLGEGRFPGVGGGGGVVQGI